MRIYFSIIAGCLFAGSIFSSAVNAEVNTDQKIDYNVSFYHLKSISNNKMQLEVFDSSDKNVNFSQKPLLVLSKSVETSEKDIVLSVKAGHGKLLKPEAVYVDNDRNVVSKDSVGTIYPSIKIKLKKKEAGKYSLFIENETISGKSVVRDAEDLIELPFVSKYQVTSSKDLMFSEGDVIRVDVPTKSKDEVKGEDVYLISMKK